MGEKTIIQVPTDQTLIGNVKGGIDIYGRNQSGCYFSKDIDFDTDQYGVRAQIRPTEDVTQSSLATLDDVPTHMVEANGSKIYILTAANEIFENNAGSYTRVNVSAQTGHGQGLVEYDDDLFYVQDSKVGKYDGATFSDTWQSRSVSNSSYGPAKKFLGKFYVGSGRYVDSWDGVSWKAADLTLPANEIIRSFEVWNDLLVIGCGSGKIYFWNGTSESYDEEEMVPDGAPVDVIKEFLNRLFVISGRNARIFEFDGSQFVERAFIPDIRLSGFDLSAVTVWSGAVSGWQDKILFMVAISSSVNSIRTKSGVWSYSVSTNRLNFEFSVSSGQMGTGLTLGALYFDEGAETLYIGYKDTNAGSKGVYIDNLDFTNDDTDEGNYLITRQLLPAEFALAFLRRFYVNCSKFASPSSAKIIIAVRIDDDEELITGPLTCSTGPTISKFTTASSVSLISPGDMIEVIEGPSSRDIRFVSAVDNAASPKEITVSEQFSVTPVNSQTKIMAYRYQKIGEVAAEDALTLKSLEILREAKKAWIFIEIRGRASTTGERTTFKKGTLDMVQRPNA